VSAGLETGATVIERGAGPLTLTRVAFAARARRLLRAAYVLLDNDHAPEAVGLFRTMNEYLIVGRWLAIDPEKHVKLWAEDDVAKALLVDERTFEHGDFRLLDAETRGLYERHRDELRAELRPASDAEPPAVCETCGRPLSKAKRERLPPLEQMAQAVELELAYQTAYRLDSQSAVHATGMAVNHAYDEAEQGYVLRPAPHLALAGIDSYALGAHLLLDLLVDIASQIPELGWMPMLELVREMQRAITAADPESESAKARRSET
jgi:Family of unknown function (DUF5677)